MSRWFMIVAIVVVAFLIGAFIPPRAGVQALSGSPAAEQSVIVSTSSW